ncbi:MAG TPA: hypothetical protein VD866_17765 [Urbifossiella sp.]|nr:hypothetical protein [Urbifossiella sp.]
MVDHLAPLRPSELTPAERAAAIAAQMREVKAAAVSEADAAAALAGFDPVWAALAPAERARVIGLLVEKVVYDGLSGKVAVTFRPAGITACDAGGGRRRPSGCGTRW